MSEHRKVPDWQWLSDLLAGYDITEKSPPYTKNRRDFLSLEARLYTELQKRYKPRKKLNYSETPNGGRTSKEYDNSNRIHSDQIKTMHDMGYGLLLDGFTFYKYGYELEPWNFEMNFTMHHAYEVHRLSQTAVIDMPKQSPETTGGLAKAPGSPKNKRRIL